jgi:lipopolysaccharide export system permease protein
MRKTKILSRYLIWNFLRMFLSVMIILLSIVYLFDMMELLRRASGREGTSITLVLEMSLYKLMGLEQVIVPFGVLFAGMACFWWLAKRHELTAMRAAGFSAWQFVAPLALAAFVIGLVHIMILHPVSAGMVSKYEDLESEYFSQHKKLITISQHGLWLREADSQGEVIIHADTVVLEDWSLKGLTVLFFDEQGTHTRRLDAESVALKPGRWVFKNGVSRDPNMPDEPFETSTLATDLTLQDIQESFSDPDTISFWKLPDFIKTLRDTGLETTPMEVYYQSLLTQPLLFAAMIMLAATVSLRPPRFQSPLLMLVSGIGLGFVVFFMSSFLRALGNSHQLPATLAAWSTVIIVMLGSITWLLNTEDG